MKYILTAQKGERNFPPFNSEDIVNISPDALLIFSLVHEAYPVGNEPRGFSAWKTPTNDRQPVDVL
ncbi:MAG: hypothetical protein ACR2MG_04960 [Pyrinomonadaceae bacterium]